MKIKISSKSTCKGIRGTQKRSISKGALTVTCLDTARDCPISQEIEDLEVRIRIEAIIGRIYSAITSRDWNKDFIHIKYRSYTHCHCYHTYSFDIRLGKIQTSQSEPQTENHDIEEPLTEKPHPHQTFATFVIHSTRIQIQMNAAELLHAVENSPIDFNILKQQFDARELKKSPIKRNQFNQKICI